MKRQSLEISTDYLSKVYNPKLYKRSVKKMTTRIKKFIAKIPIDAIAFTGTSGAAFAYPISLELNLPLVCVRKPGSHCYLPIEGRKNIKNYIIVDDFISSGATLRKIILKIKMANPLANLQAIFLYDDSNNRKTWDSYPIFNIK